MPENRLGIGGVVFPTAKDQYQNDLKIALEAFVNLVRDNIEHLSKPPVTSIDGDYTATDLDSTVVADATGGNITVTLPQAMTVQGMILTVKKVDGSGNTVTVDGYSSETIDGATTKVLSSQYEAITIHSSGSEWFVF